MSFKMLVNEMKRLENLKRLERDAKIKLYRIAAEVLEQEATIERITKLLPGPKKGAKK